MAKKGGSSGRYSAQEVAEAIITAGGFVTKAARVLGCSPTTVYSYINRHAKCREAVQEARERMLDTAEGKLFQQILDGNMTAIIFYLKTQGKGRGYIERQEVTGTDGGAVTIRVVYDDARATG